jgi:hypothetical protein
MLTTQPVRSLSDGEELVLADESPMSPGDLPEPDPRSSALQRRREALNAPGQQRRFARGAGV